MDTWTWNDYALLGLTTLLVIAAML